MTRPEAREAKRRAADAIMRAGLATIFQEWLDLNDLVICRNDWGVRRDTPTRVYVPVDLREMYPEVNS